MNIFSKKRKSVYPVVKENSKVWFEAMKGAISTGEEALETAETAVENSTINSYTEGSITGNNSKKLKKDCEGKKSIVITATDTSVKLYEYSCYIGKVNNKDTYLYTNVSADDTTDYSPIMRSVVITIDTTSTIQMTDKQTIGGGETAEGFNLNVVYNGSGNGEIIIYCEVNGVKGAHYLGWDDETYDEPCITFDYSPIGTSEAVINNVIYILDLTNGNVDLTDYVLSSEGYSLTLTSWAILLGTTTVEVY